MRERWRRQLEAYRDGALPIGRRERLERLLRSDPESAQALEEIESLGTAVRAAWTEGPPAPTPEYLIQALRPALARADAELVRPSRLRRALTDALDFVRPTPIGALVASAAAVLLFILSYPQPLWDGGSIDVPIETQLNVPRAIYDLGSVQVPILVFEGEDGSTFIWLVEDDAEEGLTRHWTESDGWA